MSTDDRRPDDADGSLDRGLAAPDANKRDGGDDARLPPSAEWEGLFDNLTDMVTVHDGQFNIIHANRSARRMLSLPLSGRLTDSKCFACYHGTEKPPAGCPSCRCAETLEEIVSEVFEPHLNRYLEVRAIPRLDAHRRYIGVVHVVRDITERKRAEQAQRESDEQYRLAVNATNDGMWDINFRDGTARFNTSYVEAFGRPSENEDPWLWWIDHVHPDDRDRTLSSFDAAVNGPADVWKCEYRFRRIDGTWANTYDHAYIRRDSTGKADYVIGALADITERTSREEEKARLLAIIEESPDFIGVADVQGNLQYHNRAAKHMVGLPDDADLSHMKIGDMHPAWAAKLIEEEGIPAIFRGGTWRNENVLLHRNGSEIPVSQVLVLHRNSTGEPKFISTIMRDITAPRRAEEEQATLQTQLQQAQKMESIGRLAGGVAHDFNNMLGVILGHTELALEQVDPALSLHVDLEEIRNATMRSADLTRQLLAFARKQAVAPKVLHLNDTVAGMLRMLQRLIGENIDLKWQPGEDLWLVKVDPSQIDQILANLCVNARDAISGVGKMTLETGNSTLDEGYCASHTGCVPGEYVRLAVGDDGSGMTPETVAHVFEPFFTTKVMGKGTGLGLATVYGIVKQNSGYIDVNSELNLGTTFTVYLPRHVGEDEKARPEGAATTMLRGDETILLVEDELSFLTLTRRMLEERGYTVLAASGPGEALRLAREHAGKIHLLMTDVVMPEMDGRALATSLLSVLPLVKCLFMSGYTTDVIAQHGVLDEGLHFIQKPFGIDSLAAKVREALDAG
ncbi:MAG: PAS domain S-box protein [Acidobacteria bacterium]|nr:PAS domain S-box protein [Acidobacteriota bacterium]